MELEGFEGLTPEENVTNLTRAMLTVVMVGLMTCTSWAAESVRVTVGRANLRAEPNTKSPIVAKVGRGAALEVLGREDGWLRVAAPNGGGPAYIAARLCEAMPMTTPSPTAAQPAAPAPSFSSSGLSGAGGSGHEPGQFGGHLSWATKGVGFGLGARASAGIPVVPHLGALLTVDVFFGGRSRVNAAGVELDEGGHSLQLGLYPTYNVELQGVHVYAGAGLSYFRSSYGAPAVPVEPLAAEPAETLPGSASGTSLALIAGATVRKHFFAELRYQFGGASHLTFSTGIVFDAPW